MDSHRHRRNDSPTGHHAASAELAGRSRAASPIVSAHIRRHSVWDIVLKGLVQHLDPAAFQLTIYHLGHIEDGETQFAKAAANQWRDASALEASTGWAALIASDQQDVLYYPELGMDPTVYMLAQQRLAPLQSVGWGHPITTGITSIDLFFSGELLEPADAQQHYREQLIRLPGTGCCTTAFDVQALPCPYFQHHRSSIPTRGLLQEGCRECEPVVLGKQGGSRFE